MKKLPVLYAIAGVCFFAVFLVFPLPSLAYTTTTVTSNITSDTTWVSDYIYIVNSTISVDAGIRLTVEPGAIVKFNGSTAGLSVNGLLASAGTGMATSQKAIFTSYNDDTGGDTNGGSTQAAPRDWDAIRINANASSTLAYALIRYGG